MCRVRRKTWRLFLLDKLISVVFVLFLNLGARGMCMGESLRQYIHHYVSGVVTIGCCGREVILSVRAADKRVASTEDCLSEHFSTCMTLL